MADAPKAAEAPARAYQISTSRFRAAEAIRNVWSIVPEAGTPYASVLKREYWANISNRLRPADRIEVMPEDGTFFAELIVRSTGNSWASVAELRKVDLADDKPADDALVAVRWLDPHKRYGVVRVKDNHVLRHGFQDKGDALKWSASTEAMKAAA